jgi:thiol-disulfide isomerase/thioredoxin
MKRRDLVTGLFLAAAAGAFFMFARTPATNVETAYDGEPELIAATFASAWCSACKILKPRLARAIKDFDGKPVKFVEYDFTFGKREEAREAASKDGVLNLYDRLAGATGFTVLVDAETGEVIDTLTMNHSRKAMGESIERALVIASAR